MLTRVRGQGVLSRKYGITADFVEAIEVVTAEGERVIARADQATHKELLWLARGGGAYPHFPGVITRLMLRFLPMDFQAKNCISFKVVVCILRRRALAMLVVCAICVGIEDCW